LEGETIMAKRCDHYAEPSIGIDPIIRLWLLRILVTLGGHRQFMHSHGFNNDTLAEALGVLARSGLVSVDRRNTNTLRCKLDLLSEGFADLMISSEANPISLLRGAVSAASDTDLAKVAAGLSAARSGRLCLYGPPGTGKSAYGRCLAEQLGIPLQITRSSDLMSMWVGGTEKNIARAFRQAEQDEALLLIDEVDSFLQDRRGAQRGWEVSLVNEMLTQMESFPGVFIASTNLMAGLDQAALRRFDLKVKFDFLRPEQAWELLRRQCEKLSFPAPQPGFGGH
jgi:hypothetical protein